MPLVIRPVGPPAAATRVAAVAIGVAALVLTACTTTVTGTGQTPTSGPASGPTRASSSAPAQPSGTVQPGASAAPSVSTARFTDCANRFEPPAAGFPAGRRAQLSFGCAAIEVPLDYSQPNGRRISLQLLRVHDTAAGAHPRALLVNPGGPGGSGVAFAAGLATRVSDTLLAHFDLIGFDPRGVGLSTPIHCLTDAQKDDLNAASPDIRTVTGFAQAESEAAQVASLCAAKVGSGLRQFDTVQTAQDMDLIRRSVGDAPLNYLGFSYGTELGAQYARLFPRLIKVMVLDGAVDPLTADITAFANQLQGFEGAFDQFAAWCTQHTPCSSLGAARQAVYAIVAAARRSPIPSLASGETRTATTSLVITGVLSALYSSSRWATLGQALIDATNGDSEGLLALADAYNERVNGRYSNFADATLTIGCNDSRPGPDVQTIRRTTASWVTRFPMFGLWAAPALFSCQAWQPHRTVPPLPTAPTTAHRVLVIGNLHDPATPYRGAIDLATTLGNAQVLSWDGEGHTSYLQGSSCVDGYVDAYLVTGRLPPAGRTCPR